MRTMFQMGFQHPAKRYLGQWESLISTAISAGVDIYKVRSQEEQAKDALKFKEEQAAAAARREQEALRIQQEAIKALNQPKESISAPGMPGETILGLQPTTFFIVAGLSAGVLVLGTMLLSKGK